MNAIDGMADEINRHLNAEAGGDPSHPGARLRVLLLLNIADDDQRPHLERDVREAGFLPWSDRYDPETGQRFCSVGAVARACGVSEATMQAEIDAFIASDIGRRLGFCREILFPDSEECCSLH